MPYLKRHAKLNTNSCQKIDVHTKSLECCANIMMVMNNIFSQVLGTIVEK